MKVIILFMLLPGLAIAEPDAKARFAAGQTLVAEKKYDAAYEEFRTGYELSHRPLFQFNMGECARLAGDAVRARKAYERYLAEEPTGALARKARERIAGLPAPPIEAPPPVEPVIKVVAPKVAVSLPKVTELTQLPPFIPVPEPEAPLLWKRWPFWATVGVAALSAVAVYAYATHGQPGETDCGADCVQIDWSLP